MKIEDLVPLIGAIAASNDTSELTAALTDAAKFLGFASFNISLRKTAPQEFMSAPTLTNWDQAALEGYVREGWSERDPLLLHAGSGGAPLFWQSSNWKDDARHDDYFRYLVHADVTGGITIPLSEGPKLSSALTMPSNGPSCAKEGRLSAAIIIANTARLRMAAFGSETRVSALSIQRLRNLSARQLEILGWMASGKTNFEIGIIIGTGKRTVDYHVRQILTKLCVSSRTEAVALYAAR